MKHAVMVISLDTDGGLGQREMFYEMVLALRETFGRQFPEHRRTVTLAIEEVADAVLSVLGGTDG